MKPTHTPILLDYKGSKVEIDEELVPLIQRLWAHGISTDFCCQGDKPGGEWDKLQWYAADSRQPAYISFSTREDFDKLVRLVDGGFLTLSRIIGKMFMPSHRSQVNIYFDNAQIPELYFLIKETYE